MSWPPCAVSRENPAGTYGTNWIFFQNVARGCKWTLECREVGQARWRFSPEGMTSPSLSLLETIKSENMIAWRCTVFSLFSATWNLKLGILRQFKRLSVLTQVETLIFTSMERILEGKLTCFIQILKLFFDLSLEFVQILTFVMKAQGIIVENKHWEMVSNYSFFLPVWSIAYWHCDLSKINLD